MYHPDDNVIIGAFVNLFLMVIQLIFIILKLTNQLDWSWWVVLIPWCLPTVALFALCLFLIIVCGIVQLSGKMFGYTVFE